MCSYYEQRTERLLSHFMIVWKMYTLSVFFFFFIFVKTKTLFSMQLLLIQKVHFPGNCLGRSSDFSYTYPGGMDVRFVFDIDDA